VIVSTSSRRPLSLLGALLTLSALSSLAACTELNCPDDFVKVGARCRPLGDAGPQSHHDAAMPDASAPGADCKNEDECGNPAVFDCIDGTCTQSASCSPDNPCGGAYECSSGTCVPFVPPDRLPSSVVSTSGGGTTRSSNYVLRLSIGTPQPMGNAKSSAYSLSAGPGAGPN
jgi:hypothetical protein